jgi:DNA-binding NarL/FixJ family response regulator
MYRLMIIDDHPLFRAGVVRALRDAMDVDEVAEAGSVKEAMAKLAVGSFDLAIVDIGLPDRSGLELVEALARKAGAPRFFILSMNSDRSSVRKALQMGAMGYSTKSIALASLVLGLRLVLEGELFVEAELLRDLLTMSLREPEFHPELLGRFETLTAREREVLDALLNGLAAKEIAFQLGLSLRTAENYQSSIYLKIGAKSPVDLVKLAQRAGMMIVPEGNQG